MGSNYTLTSDGAATTSTGQSSAAWAIFQSHGHEIVLIAAGATSFPSYQDSMCAEVAGLELATTALMNLIIGRDRVTPHKIDITFDKAEILGD